MVTRDVEVLDSATDVPQMDSISDAGRAGRGTADEEGGGSERDIVEPVFARHLRPGCDDRLPIT